MRCLTCGRPSGVAATRWGLILKGDVTIDGVASPANLEVVIASHHAEACDHMLGILGDLALRLSGQVPWVKEGAFIITAKEEVE